MFILASVNINNVSCGNGGVCMEGVCQCRPFCVGPFCETCITGSTENTPIETIHVDSSYSFTAAMEEDWVVRYIRPNSDIIIRIRSHFQRK